MKLAPALGLGGLGLTVLLVFAHPFIPVPDVYNHLARDALLAHAGAPGPFWVSNWRPLPNLAIDGLALALLPWLPMERTAQVIIAASFALLVAGVVSLARAAHGRATATSWASVLLLLNRTLFQSQVNYLIGVAFSLLTAAAWLGTERRPAALRWAGLAVLATLTWFVHIFAFAESAILLGGLELAAWPKAGARRTLGRLFLVGSAYLPGVILYVLATPADTVAGRVIFRSIINRLTAFSAPLTYDPAPEALCVLSLLGLILLAGRVRFEPRLLVSAALLVAIQLVIPETVGSAFAVDRRLPIAIWAVLFATVDVRIRAGAPRVALLGVLSALLLGRLAVAHLRWTADDRVYRQAELALRKLPDGAKVATAYAPSVFTSMTNPAMALPFLPAWDVVPRGGFTQTLWTVPSQHPLIMRPAWRLIADSTPPSALWRRFVVGAGPALPEEGVAIVDAALQSYDFVAFVDPAPFTVAPSPQLDLFDDGGDTKLYRVRHTR